MNLDDLLAELDGRVAGNGANEEPKFCGCQELLGRGRQMPVPRYHDCEYVRARNAL